MAEPLDKAYEAFRLVAIDRDNALKELKQKSGNYEQRIRELQKEIEGQKRLITHLMSQLANNPTAGKGNAYGIAHCLPHEETEARRRDGHLNLTSEQLQEKLKAALQAEKHFKDQWENERLKSKQIEEEHSLKIKAAECYLKNKDAQVVLLTKKLKEANERLEKVACNNIQMCDTVVQNKRLECPAGQDVIPVATCISAIHITERDDVEKIFWEMKEEFRNICKLTKDQTDRLRTFKPRRDNATEAQFSMPIQCTDTADEQVEGVFKPQVKKEVNKAASSISITPRGLQQDEDGDCSVESLSQFSVKFPPTDHDSVFLQSTPEKTVFSSPVGTENVFQEKCIPLLDDPVLSLSELVCRQSEAQGKAPMLENIVFIENIISPHLGDAYVLSNQDVTPPLTAENHGGIFQFPQQEAPEGSLCAFETTKREIRGPQQPYWKPYPDQNKDVPLTPGYAESEANNSGVCEFCQAVFPPSSTSRGDFLRHLNSHFKEHA
ncbi:TRAF family member-associated NF-kappa-B activator [Ambystoma mexicanum]|uniref:TRAF family member-associated NF-kappa-B activator n=1 Tax=Ambystoma mexicanum TaxID=8296 RepID=UPI0037E72DF8